MFASWPPHGPPVVTFVGKRYAEERVQKFRRTFYVSQYSRFSSRRTLVLLWVVNSNSDDNAQNGKDEKADNELHSHVLPPHLVSKIIRVLLKDSSLLLKLFCSRLNRFKFHAILESDIDILLHHQFHGIDFTSNCSKLINLCQVVILRTNLLKQRAAWWSERIILGSSSFLANLGWKLKVCKDHCRKFTAIFTIRCNSSIQVKAARWG